MRGLLALILAPAGAQMLGGNVGGAHAASDVGPNSDVAALAEYSFKAVKANCAADISQGSNSFACSKLAGGLMYVGVASATTQVVSGTKFSIDVKTSGTELVKLEVYEQPWTQTLSVQAASLVGVGSLLGGKPSLALSHGDYMKFSAARGEGGCTGGRVWKQCGSPCEKKCGDEEVMCMTMCVPKCNCPRGQVVGPVTLPPSRRPPPRASPPPPPPGPTSHMHPPHTGRHMH